jgi:hypothetical protein
VRLQLLPARLLPGQPRPFGFNDPIFNVDQPYDDPGDDFAVSDPQNPEDFNAYRLGLVERLGSGEFILSATATSRALVRKLADLGGRARRSGAGQS